MKKLFGGVVISVFVLLAVVTALFMTHQRVPLGFLATPAAGLLSVTSGSEISIDGNYYLTLGRWLILAADNSAVTVTSGDGSRISAAVPTFETTIHLPSLLKKQLVLDGVTLVGMRLDLHPEEDEKPQRRPEKKGNGSHSAFSPSALHSVGEISLADIVIRVFPAGQKVPIEYQIQQGTGNFTAGSAGRLAIDGLVDSTALTVSAETGPLNILSDELAAWPFSLQLGHKSLTALIRGQAAMVEGSLRGEAGFSLQGDHWDDLSSLYGDEGSTNKPFAAEGSVELAGRAAKLQISRIEPGGSDLLVTAMAEDYGLPDVHYSLKVAGGSLNLDVLNDLITSPGSGEKKQGSKGAENPIGRDTVVLPPQSPVSDLELNLALDGLTFAGKLVKDLRFSAVIEDGIVKQAPFSAVLKNSSLTGHLGIARENGLPHITARLKSASFDIGAFLYDFHLAEGVEMQIAEMSTDLSTQGRTVGELIDGLSFTTSAKDGIYILHDRNTGGRLPVQLHHSTITAAPGTGLQFQLRGEARQSPFAIAIHFGDRHPDQKTAGRDEASFSAVITVEASRIEFDGKVPVPVRAVGTTLNGRMSSRQVSDFNDLLHLHLPRVGPMTLAGTLQIVPKGYRLEGVHLDVGTSSLEGSLTVDTTLELPELTVDLLAEEIQLDDFRVAKDPSENDTAPAEPAALHGETGEPGKKMTAKNLLYDQEILKKYNARVTIEVSDVFSGGDNLGRGKLAIDLRNGKLAVRPVHLDLPGGGVDLALNVEPDGEVQRYLLTAEISNLDYGTVGRWLKPDTDMKGVVSIRSFLQAKSADFRSIMAGANGYVDFYIHPEQLRAGVVDLWAVNLLHYLIPFLTPDDDSVINCAAGRFNIADGLLNQEDLLIDTTHVQVKGTVFVDFNKNWIEAILKPKPKSAQFLSLATPLEIRGELSKFKTGVPSGGMIGTVARNMSSVVTVPLKRIFQEKMPRDGTASCRKLFEKPRLQPAFPAK